MILAAFCRILGSLVLVHILRDKIDYCLRAEWYACEQGCLSPPSHPDRSREFHLMCTNAERSTDDGQLDVCILNDSRFGMVRRKTLSQGPKIQAEKRVRTRETENK